MRGIILAASLLCVCGMAEAAQGTASYYTVASCLREGTSGIMANGKPLDDSKLTCASWDYPFGTRLRLSHGQNSVVVTVTDRGPNKKLYRKGRIIDLSKEAFQRLAPLKAGVIPIDVERV